MNAIENHPCFNAEAKHTHARVHLPVAPKCNVLCNYCNRLYDCVNESRPGVTSAILSPFQSVEYLKILMKKMDNISVVGIAGPGDPFANPEETIETLRQVKKEFPDKILCLSTNGLNINPYIDELAEIGVSNVTITINAIDPDIISQIYAWVRFEKKVYRGVDAARVIIEQQLLALKMLKEKNIIVKINTIVLPGINDHHIEAVAEKVSSLGADLMNCIPVYPNKDTAFEDIEEPSKELMKDIRKRISKYIKPMTHCARCRADAAGLLGQDDKEAMCIIQEVATMPLVSGVNTDDRPYVAVASYEGLLVNQHLGEAESVYIFKATANGYRHVEQRKLPQPGNGDFRWMEMGRILNDCRAILVSGVGPNPLKILQRAGIRVIQMTGLIDEGMDAVYKGTILKTIKKADAFRCGQSCKGTATGCG